MRKHRMAFIHVTSKHNQCNQSAVVALRRQGSYPFRFSLLVSLQLLRKFGVGAYGFFFQKDFTYVFLQRGREPSLGCLLYTPQLGIEPITQACALSGNRTIHLLLCGTVLNQLNHTHQGLMAS